MEHVRRHAGAAWREFAVSLMPLVSREACGALAHRLGADGADDAVAEARLEILARTDSRPGAMVWLWRQCAAEQGAGGAPEPEPVAVVIAVLNALARLVRAADLTEEGRRQAIAELRTALFLRAGAPLQQALEAAAPRQVAAVRALGARNPALTDGMQADLNRILERVQPSLFLKHVRPWDEDVVYTTEAGLARRRAELEHIVHVRLPEVMREIGQAAGFGDISDNAEYQSAVQERARLAERAGRIQQEIAGARLITPDLASADHVTVGSRVRVHNLSTGQEETFAFLGPWDAEPDAAVFAYDAPLGAAFMGKRAGETVNFRAGPEERRWEILAVECGL